MKKLKTFLIFCLVLSSTIAYAQKDLFKEMVHIKGEDTLKYRIMYPENFSEDNEYPVVLFLHGAGERGDDNTKQLAHGSKLFTNKMNRGAFSAIVIFPQCPQDSYWSNANVDRSSYPISLEFPKDKEATKPMQLVIDLMQEVTRKDYVNKAKVYVGGLSMGGMGTFEILSRQPDMFAAAFAICGNGNAELAKLYANKVEMWIFHGAKDDVVDPKGSIKMVNAILENGGKPNFTLYADDNHNSWDSAFAEPELLTWLFSKSKK
ncbi:prolyl oligopeptidase family serine peptidase [Winogradskyella litoriviva]|uniref:Prolyl oligopeptidase family serine peptidase n=1 Tax=Winogradskyella litoriviva TaxID=1220182 RepID=A0ABX2E297_9FLAO|nr:prolyl oligopeptidase family serine peptidase [Winogradskyella litoriviva]NRD22237.1 prolyl oligopeptidase family serine peptidase [Winogradskyella litoriviva]